MLSNIEYIILGIIGALWLIQMLYLIFFYNAINRAHRQIHPTKRDGKRKKKQAKTPTKEVITSADEAETEEITIDMEDALADTEARKPVSKQKNRVMSEAADRDYDEIVRPQEARQLSFFDSDDDIQPQESQPSPISQKSEDITKTTTEPAKPAEPEEVAVQRQKSPARETAETTATKGNVPCSNNEEICPNDKKEKESSPTFLPHESQENMPSSEKNDTSLPFLSIIIVTCNQGSLLRRNLPFVLEQDYPAYEVIVVNDNSNDDTAEILESLKQHYPHLRTTFTSDSARRISHRKLALTLGIKGARGEWVVFTEPQCCPAGNKWLRALTEPIIGTSHNQKAVDAVVGYTRMEHSGGFASTVRVAENMLRNVRLLCSALTHTAYMGYGSNLAYKRELFFRNKGYSAHLNLERGDDDIFVNENIAPVKIRAAVEADASVVVSHPDSREWTMEKTGRIATQRYLHGLMPHLMTMESVSRALYALGTICFLVLALIKGWWLAAGITALLWIVRHACQQFILLRTRRALHEHNFAPLLALLDGLLPLMELHYRIRYLLTPKSTYRRKQL